MIICTFLKATEAVLDSYRNAGALPRMPHFNSIFFGLISSILVYFHRINLEEKPDTSNPGNHENQSKDVIFSILR